MLLCVLSLEQVMELIPGLPNDIARECLIRLPYKQFCKFFCVCKGWKEEMESEQFHRRRKSNGSTQNLIVLAQADPSSSSPSVKHPATPIYRISLYEPATGLWNTLPAAPGCANGLPIFCHCVAVGRFLVVIGGWDPSSWKASNSVFIYNFLSGKWKHGNDMPGQRRSFFGCASDSHETVFVGGGHDEEKNALRSALAYNVTRDEWVSVGEMARERDECKGVFKNGKFHVIGGYCTEAQGQFETSAEVFDAATWRWGNVDEDYLIEKGICPRTCVMDGETGKMYKCFEDHLEVLECGTWRSFIDLPADVRVGPFLMMWQRKVLVIGSDVFGGSHRAYLLELNTNKGIYTWKKTEIPQEFTGKVQSGCSLEI